jgi:hypothetical protein
LDQPDVQHVLHIWLEPSIVIDMTTTTLSPAPAHITSSDTPCNELFIADCGHLTDRSVAVPCGSLDGSLDCEDCAQEHIDDCGTCLAA